MFIYCIKLLIMRNVIFAMLLLPALVKPQQFKAGLSASVMSSIFVGPGTNNNIYIDEVSGAFLELRSAWGVRCTVQYFRQRGAVRSIGMVSARKTSAEICGRRYLGNTRKKKMEWYIGLGVNVPVAISHQSIEQEPHDWAMLVEFGRTRKRWGGGIFFVTSHDMMDNLPTMEGFQHWAKLGLRIDYTLFK